VGRIGFKDQWKAISLVVAAVALTTGVLLYSGTPKRTSAASPLRRSAHTIRASASSKSAVRPYGVRRWTVRIPYAIRTERDIHLAIGVRKIVRGGRDGLYAVREVYAVRGMKVFTARTRSLVRRATPELVALGPTEVSRGSDGVATKTLDVKITAYSAPAGDHTATGSVVGLGTIAVDPNVIPYGTRLYVPGYGYGVADDTGSAIIGDHIDIFFPTYRQAVDWGAHYEQITIYGS